MSCSKASGRAAPVPRQYDGSSTSFREHLDTRADMKSRKGAPSTSCPPFVAMMVPLLLVLSSLVLALSLFSLRLLLIIHHTHARSSPPARRRKDAPASVAVFLGSGELPVTCGAAQVSSHPFEPAGGHTAEMMRLVSGLDWQRYSTRVWIVSSGDQLSESKALALEKHIGTGSVRLCSHEAPHAR